MGRGGNSFSDSDSSDEEVGTDQISGDLTLTDNIQQNIFDYTENWNINLPYILLGTLAIGNLLVFVGTNSVDNDCLIVGTNTKSNIAWLLVFLGAGLSFISIGISLLISDCWNCLPLCNRGRIEITKIIILVIIMLIFIYTLLIPNFMIVTLLILPDCGYSFTIFIAIYTLIALLFNMLSILLIALGIKCYRAE